MVNIDYTIVGLCLDIIGVWGVAYELLWGYPKDIKKQILKNQLKSQIDHNNQVKAINSRLSVPPYSVEERDKIIRNDEAEIQLDIKAIRDEINLLSQGHHDRSFLFGFIGIFLLTLGFIFQIIGAL